VLVGGFRSNRKSLKKQDCLVPDNFSDKIRSYSDLICDSNSRRRREQVCWSWRVEMRPSSSDLRRVRDSSAIMLFDNCSENTNGNTKDEIRGKL